MILLLSRRLNFCFCNIRSNFGCNFSGISFISSRNREFLFVSLKRSIRWALVSVKVLRL